MNKVQIRMILRENPVSVSWRGKTHLIKWQLESLRSTTGYQLITEGITVKSNLGASYTKYIGGVDLLERGFKYIFPRISGISLRKIFEMNKEFLLVELSYVRHYNKTTKVKTPDIGDFGYVTRACKETVRGYWRIYRDRLPERLDMRKTENKEWYKKKFGYSRQEQQKLLGELFKT